jgi:hypothetical protein
MLFYSKFDNDAYYTNKPGVVFKISVFQSYYAPVNYHRQRFNLTKAPTNSQTWRPSPSTCNLDNFPDNSRLVGSKCDLSQPPIFKPNIILFAFSTNLHFPFESDDQNLVGDLIIGAGHERPWGPFLPRHHRNDAVKMLSKLIWVESSYSEWSGAESPSDVWSAHVRVACCSGRASCNLYRAIPTRQLPFVCAVFHPTHCRYDTHTHLILYRGLLPLRR